MTPQEIGVYLGGLGTGLFMWLGNRAIEKAKRSAEQAGYGADTAGYAAENVLYTQLSDRLAHLERETAALRVELDSERRRSRDMEIHIWKLENIMRKANLEPPVFIPIDVVKSEVIIHHE